MDCQELKPVLLEYVDKERDATVCQEFIKHSRECPDCYHKFKLEVSFRDLIKTKSKTETVSEELINKIKTQLKKLQKDISIGEKGW
ncbi:MAG TPA: hypothetical protein VJ165_05245 [candidate division Zixibacteria bacterium]|nr:hypothetical protein [candidate division Zixibacteria bacterium]